PALPGRPDQECSPASMPGLASTARSPRAMCATWPGLRRGRRAVDAPARSPAPDRIREEAARQSFRKDRAQCERAASAALRVRARHRQRHVDVQPNVEPRFELDVATRPRNELLLLE